jgi:hypothetical protein
MGVDFLKFIIGLRFFLGYGSGLGRVRARVKLRVRVRFRVPNAPWPQGRKDTPDHELLQGEGKGLRRERRGAVGKLHGEAGRERGHVLLQGACVLFQIQNVHQNLLRRE